MTQRVLAAWTSSDLMDYPDFVTITQDAEQVKIKIRGTDGLSGITDVTMDKKQFMRLAIQALSQVTL